MYAYRCFCFLNTHTHTHSTNTNTNSCSIEGGELFDRVIDDEFVLTEKTCVVLIRQLCEAMEFVHSNNILHLDLKPENILCLTREGNRIKVIDFGLARRYDPDKKLQVSFFSIALYTHFRFVDGGQEKKRKRLCCCCCCCYRCHSHQLHITIHMA